MHLSYKRAPRGPYLFETWRSTAPVPTVLGALLVELYTPIDAQPTPPMIAVASSLASFAASSGDHLLDIIHAHYRYAEAQDWLSTSSTPGGLQRRQILDHVKSIVLCVHADLEATVHVDPAWDQEHKLALTFEAGYIVKANDQPFALTGGMLRT